MRTVQHGKSMARFHDSCRLAVLVVLFCAVRECRGADITCDAPAVDKGDPANITCYFNEDVRLSKQNIKINRTPLNTEGFDSDTLLSVVECYWADAESFKCKVGDGYELQGQVTKQATVRIPKATETFVGNYMCEVIPNPEASDVKRCEFHLKDDPESLNIQLSLPTFEEKLEQIKQIIAVALAILVIVPLVVIAGMVMRTSVQPKVRQLFIKHFRSGKTPGTSEEQPLQTDAETSQDQPTYTATDDESRNSFTTEESHVPDVERMANAVLANKARAGVFQQDLRDPGKSVPDFVGQGRSYQGESDQSQSGQVQSREDPPASKASTSASKPVSVTSTEGMKFASAPHGCQFERPQSPSEVLPQMETETVLIESEVDSSDASCALLSRTHFKPAVPASFYKIHPMSAASARLDVTEILQTVNEDTDDSNDDVVIINPKDEKENTVAEETTKQCNDVGITVDPTQKLTMVPTPVVRGTSKKKTRPSCKHQ